MDKCKDRARAKGGDCLGMESLILIITVGLGFKENIDTAETLIKRVQFFRRKVSRVTSGSASLSITCVESRKGIIKRTESVTQWSICRGLLDLGIGV